MTWSVCGAVCAVVLLCVLLLLRKLHRTFHHAYHLDTCQYSIRPWHQVSDRVRSQTASALEAEWGSDYSTDYIMRTWLSEDTFYVMTGRTGGFVGCVGLDRKQTYPFVSHLLVIPSQRSKGYASVLLHLCEQQAAKMGFTAVRLWCEPALVPFYTKLGWEAEEEMDGKTVFRKQVCSAY